MRTYVATWTRCCWLLVVATVLAWVGMFVAVILVEAPMWGHPWWFAIFRSPALVGLVAAWTVGLLLRMLLVPHGIAWYMTYEVMKDDLRAELGIAQQNGQVIPLQGRRDERRVTS